jgi:hypothetical protein
MNILMLWLLSKHLDDAVVNDGIGIVIVHRDIRDDKLLFVLIVMRDRRDKKKCLHSSGISPGT